MVESTVRRVPPGEAEPFVVGSAFVLASVRRPGVRDLLIHVVVVTVDVARAARLLAVLVGLVVLLPIGEQPVLRGVVVLGDLIGIVVLALALVRHRCLRLGAGW